MWISYVLWISLLVSTAVAAAAADLPSPPVPVVVRPLDSGMLRYQVDNTCVDRFGTDLVTDMTQKAFCR